VRLLSKHTPDIDADRLLQLSEEVSRISATLAKLSMGREEWSPAVSPSANDDPQVSEEAVRWIIGARNSRSRFLPAHLFADPAWDILLELLRAEIAQQRISVSSLCIAANAPATTALRYIKMMTQQGLLVREPDAFDGRRVYVTLAPVVSRALHSYCVHVFERPVDTKVHLKRI
jgi:hypothetical protein